MRTIAWVAILLAASVARAQQDQAGNGNQQLPRKQHAAATDGNGRAPSGSGSATEGAAAASATGPTSDAFDRACHDLLNGRMPSDPKAIQTLKDACGSLMSGRADERLDALKQEQAQAAAREQLRRMAEGQANGNVQPGQSSAAPQQGQGVLAAFGEAAGELTGRSPRGGMGMLRRGPAAWTLFTNPIGWFSGLGINATLFHSFEDAPKFSWVAGARYSATDATNGTASTFGAMGGADWFILGGHNAGLRIGPRLELAAGQERFGTSTSTSSFARLGLSGEVGYNFLATNGISGTAAIGLGGRVAGSDKNENFSSFVGGEFGPYLSVGLGYSW